MAVSPGGQYVYVTHGFSAHGDDTVSVIDTKAGNKVTTIRVGLPATGIAVSPDGRYLYLVYPVPARDVGVVNVVDTKTGKSAATIRVPSLADGVTVSPDGRYLSVLTYFNGGVGIIDTWSGNKLTMAGPFDGPSDVVFSPDGQRAYLASNGVGLIDMKAIGRFPPAHIGHGLGDTVSGIAVSPDGRYLYVAAGSYNITERRVYEGGVRVIDTKSGNKTTLIPGTTGVNEGEVAVSPDGRYLYATATGNGLSVIDTKAGYARTTVTIPGDFDGMTVSPDGKRVYVVSGNMDTDGILRILQP